MFGNFGIFQKHICLFRANSHFNFPLLSRSVNFSQNKDLTSKKNFFFYLISLIPDGDFLRLFSNSLKYIGQNLRVLDQYHFPETYLNFET